MISTPSWSFGVMMRSLASWPMTSLASTRRPSTSPATVALARPAPIDCATCMTETGASNWRWEPSGSVMLIMFGGPENRKGAEAPSVGSMAERECVGKLSSGRW